MYCARLQVRSRQDLDRGTARPRRSQGATAPAAIWAALNNFGAAHTDEAGMLSCELTGHERRHAHDWLNLTGGSIGRRWP